MGAISFFSCSGAPGVTTVSLATTAALTATSVQEPVMIEMASSGGVVASQYDLPSEPGLTSLSLALGGEPPDLLMHAQELPGGIPVVVAPPSGSKTAKLLEARADLMADYLSTVDATVLVDCGRIASATPLRSVLDRSTLVGIVVRASRENFQLAATTLAEINAQLARPLPAGWVIVGSCPWSHDEIVGQYGLPVLSAIAEDSVGAEAVAGLRRLRRRAPLARSVQSFADDIAKHLRVANPAAPLGYLDAKPRAGSAVPGDRRSASHSASTEGPGGRSDPASTDERIGSAAPGSETIRAVGPVIDAQPEKVEGPSSQFRGSGSASEPPRSDSPASEPQAEAKSPEASGAEQNASAPEATAAASAESESESESASALASTADEAAGSDSASTADEAALSDAGSSASANVDSAVIGSAAVVPGSVSSASAAVDSAVIGSAAVLPGSASSGSGSGSVDVESPDSESAAVHSGSVASGSGSGSVDVKSPVSESASSESGPEPSNTEPSNTESPVSASASPEPGPSESSQGESAAAEVGTSNGSTPAVDSNGRYQPASNGAEIEAAEARPPVPTDGNGDHPMTDPGSSEGEPAEINVEASTRPEASVQ